MNKTNITALISALTLAFTACEMGPQFHVEGIISEAADSMLYLEAMTLDGIQRIDSTRMKSDGRFSFSAAAPSNPEFYALRIGSRRINFSIDSTETVSFTASLPTMAIEYTVEGSYNSQKIKEIALLQMRLQSQIIALERNKSMYPGDVVDSINALITAYKERMKADYIYNEPMQAYAYYAVCQSVSDLDNIYQLFNPLTNRDDVKCYAAIATAWDGLYPDADRTKQICNMAIRGMSNTQPATERVVTIADSLITETTIIDVSLPDINGNIHNLSSLKGKVVMLDFTLYGAERSAERTRLMRDLYDKYKDKGFEIYQVSLDDDTHFWKFSCENLPWICVHETNGDAVRDYRVDVLPAFFLIDRSNSLVMRNTMITTSLEDEILKLL